MSARIIRTLVSTGLVLAAIAVSVSTQTTDRNSALNAPDEVAWRLFIQANAPAGAFA